MHYCKKCGSQLESDEIVCPKCGMRYEHCSYCGTELKMNATVCPSCGAPVQGVQSPKPPVKTQPTSTQGSTEASNNGTNFMKMLIAGVVIIALLVMFAIISDTDKSAGVNQESSSNIATTTATDANQEVSLTAEQAYKAAEDALNEYIHINWDMEKEHEDIEFEQLWEKAKRELKIAADKDYSEAKSDYGQLLLYECKNNYSEDIVDEAIKYLEMGAEGSNAKVEYILADAYLMKIEHGPSNNKESNQNKYNAWYTKAIEHGNPYALHDKAVLLRNKGDSKKALKYYKKAAEKSDDNETSVESTLRILSGGKGYSVACLYNAEVGYIYEFGVLGQKDLKEAMYWYERAGDGSTVVLGDSILEETIFDVSEAKDRVNEKQQRSKDKKQNNQQTFNNIPSKQSETKNMETQGYEMPPDTLTQPSQTPQKEAYEMP